MFNLLVLGKQAICLTFGNSKKSVNNPNTMKITSALSAVALLTAFACTNQTENSKKKMPTPAQELQIAKTNDSLRAIAFAVDDGTSKPPQTSRDQLNKEERPMGDLTTAWRCIGTDQDFIVLITNKEILFRSPRLRVEQRYPAVEPTTEGDLTVYEAVNEKKSKLVIKMKKETCYSPINHFNYGYSATVNVLDTTYHACVENLLKRY